MPRKDIEVHLLRCEQCHTVRAEDRHPQGKAMELNCRVCGTKLPHEPVYISGFAPDRFQVRVKK